MVSAGEGPTVDRGRLARLRADVGDETLRRYADAYLNLLPERLDLVERAVAADERAEALRTLTDVRVGAAMLGAHQFAARAGRLEAAVRTGSQGEVETGLAGVREGARLMASDLLKEAHHSAQWPPDPLE